MPNILSPESIHNILSEINPNVTLDDSAILYLQKVLTPLSQEVPNDKMEIQQYIRAKFPAHYAQSLISHYVRRVLSKPNDLIYQKDAIIDYIIADLLDRASSSEIIDDKLLERIMNENKFYVPI